MQLHFFTPLKRPKRPKKGYFEPKKRGIKIKKVRQKCQFLIFLMKFSQFMQFLIENNKNKIKKFWVTGGPGGY